MKLVNQATVRGNPDDELLEAFRTFDKGLTGKPDRYCIGRIRRIRKHNREKSNRKLISNRNDIDMCIHMKTVYY